MMSRDDEKAKGTKAGKASEVAEQCRKGSALEDIRSGVVKASDPPAAALAS
jgi:hypothetical protein